MKAEVYIDGAARGNPGEAGIGAVIFQGKKKILEIAEYLGQSTNNVAEYLALIRALEEVLISGNKEVQIYSDSELLVKQINGEYKVKNDQLKLLHNHAQKLIKKLDGFKIQHIGREKNKLADKLANRGIEHKLQKDLPLFA